MAKFSSRLFDIIFQRHVPSSFSINEAQSPEEMETVAWLPLALLAPRKS